MKTIKSSDFFIKKANNYIIELDNFLKENIESDPLSKRSMDSNDLSKLKTILDEIEELKLKIKLLFSEIDNGNLFVENLISRTTASHFIHISNKKVLESYKRTLELFIEHISEYKSN
ncbi:hypothetical protein CHRY9390_01195 [Chryseobacterium aquaeductus]|uniref:Uncharacterized protein n=1 Tax=Chryseobacterium aquaeductus TaxID=2675056 RepID=A0A9N8QS04_9FLAO|nr:hypothetical protein [Chryseobacterium aquaeductus]CAA7330524.1 hypothetical protein CHRY9390_01195 [Chryseobacterium potabilaquae]CAD7804239.1 hypothetical protein CHRY9390_01195 [Chryseobacterium aquaeductus]